LQGWVPAAPADALERGPWWTLFNDPVLNDLAAQRRGLEPERRGRRRRLCPGARAGGGAARLAVPDRRLSGAGTRSGTRGGGGNGHGRHQRQHHRRHGGGNVSNNYRLSLGGSWEPDVWGRLRAASPRASASAQASAADLAAARLSAQGELALDYVSTCATDAQRADAGTTIEGYQRELHHHAEPLQRRHRRRIPTCCQAETQLANAQSDLLAWTASAPSSNTRSRSWSARPRPTSRWPRAPWNVSVPDVPVGVPSTLLQRRPDIAGAERRVAAANEQIGIARSAYFPSIGLTALGTARRQPVGDLFNASNAAWSFGLSAAQTLFDAGATRARVEGARAAHEAAVARYRQTVLTAFADVEDQLAATRVLAQQQELRRQASAPPTRSSSR
jgi:NodT family efflux transporter outer membrane factor (OMF) lipoprotein